MADPLADLTRIARENWEDARHLDAHLRVAPDVRDTMRHATPPPKPRPLFGPDLITALRGIPIVVDPDLPPGTWRLVTNHDHETRQEGTIHTAEEPDRGHNH